MKRIFIAIVLSQEIRQEMSLFCKKVKKELLKDNSIRWIVPNNYHLTLKFLGDIDENQIITIYKALQLILIDVLSFNLQITKLIGLPNNNRAHVFAVSCELEKNLGLVYSCVEEALEPLGFSKEIRPFIPHITIARTKKHSLKYSLENYYFNTTQRVNSISIIESAAYLEGVEYKELYNIPLQSP